MVELRGQTALITGASRGIGRSIALALAQRGVDVALVARNAGALQEVASACQKHGVRAVALAYDLAEPQHSEAIVAETVRALGGLHILINNAGVYAHGTVGHADLQAWDALLDINVRSVVHLTHHALPEVRKVRNGAVINIASVSGKASHAGGAIYCASKHAVVGFSNALFEDVREHGIKVCAICPGYVNTDMTANSGISAELSIQPEDIAHTVLYALSLAETACPTEILLRPQRTPYRPKR